MTRLALLIVLVSVLSADLTAQTLRPRIGTITQDDGGGEEPAVPITITEKLAEGSTANATSYLSTGTFSLATNRLGLCWVFNTDANTGGDDGANLVTSLTQTGQTWTEVGTAVLSNTKIRSTLFRSLGANAAAAAVTAAYGEAQTGTAFLCRELATIDTSGTNGADAILQVNSASAFNDGSNLTGSGTLQIAPTITSSRTTGSALVVGIGMLNACTWAPRAGFTAGTEVTYASPTVEARTYEIVGGQETVAGTTVSACDLDFINWIALGVEIKHDDATDAVKPTVQILEPTTGGDWDVSTAAGFAFSGEASDNVAVTSVTYTCPQCTVTPAVSGTEDWSVTGVTLGCAADPGVTNVITVTASDAAANTRTDVINVRCRNPDVEPPVLVIEVPATTPITVSTASQVFSGTASDDTALASVGYSCATCTPTSGTDTASPAVWSFTASMTCSAGGTTNTVTITATDTATNTDAEDRVVICVSADTTDPTVTITGGNRTVTSMPVAISGTAADTPPGQVARVEGESATCVPLTNPLTNQANDWTASGTTSWTSPNLDCPPGVNTVTVRSYDTAGNASAPASVEITYVAPLSITTAVCPQGTVGTAYVCTLNASGGIPPYTWAESGTILSTDTHCDPLALTDVGDVGRISGTPKNAGLCGDPTGVTAQVTDSKATVVTKTLPAWSINASGTETAHDYFEALAARSESLRQGQCENTNRSVVNPTKGCDFRSQQQLNAVVSKPGGGAATKWTYDYTGEADASKCNGGACGDDYADPQAAAKVRFGPSDTPKNKPGEQLHINIPSRDSGTLLLTWDYYYGEEYHTNHGAVDNYKMFYTGVENSTGWWEQRILMSLSGKNFPTQAGKQENKARAGARAEGMTRVDPVTPSGPGAFAPRTYAIAHSVWTRYWMEIKLCQAPAAFTEWNAAYGVTVLDNPNNQCGNGGWHMVSIWLADENRDASRVLYRAPMNWKESGTQADYRVVTHHFKHDTSSSLLLTGEIIGYVRNYIVLYNYTLPSTEPETDTFIFKKPVR